MAAVEPESKIFGRCRSCGSVFVAERKADGTIRPIGKPAECDCGTTDFTAVS